MCPRRGRPVRGAWRRRPGRTGTPSDVMSTTGSASPTRRRCRQGPGAAPERLPFSSTPPNGRSPPLRCSARPGVSRPGRQGQVIQPPLPTALSSPDETPAPSPVGRENHDELVAGTAETAHRGTRPRWRTRRTRGTRSGRSRPSDSPTSSGRERSRWAPTSSGPVRHASPSRSRRGPRRCRLTGGVDPMAASGQTLRGTRALCRSSERKR